jgi:NADH-quinone oxidoreductase subunit G
MANTVKIIIDDKEYEVPAGISMVDAAKLHGVIIPVFCHHPKMEPVGMCRMCLVEMGNIEKDRATGEVVLDEKGSPKIRWTPKLQTACTTLTADGLVIRTDTQQVDEAQRNVVEFLLTSHPLDCPVCQKGGECPLQNQTMNYGPGVSRMYFSDKLKLDKAVPLGDLIFLDEERCIQCARCIRFQDEIVGDDVLAFNERGRRLQIITNSNPPFDTYFSGNTTDICPVGALLTVDYHHSARPWELTNVPSICPHCPVGCNTTLSTRLDRDFGGRAVVKRVMPRQNEQVNEIWICDKGRFGHVFARSEGRLHDPLVRGKQSDWNAALQAAADSCR